MEANELVKKLNEDFMQCIDSIIMLNDFTPGEKMFGIPATVNVKQGSN